MILSKAVSLSTLFKDTPIPVVKRSNNCKTYDIEYIQSNPDRTIFLVKCEESYSKDSGHLVSILYEGYRPKPRDTLKPLNDDVRVHCSCEFWKYWGSAYISTIEGYNLDVSENRPPVVRDPKLKNKLCKHVVRAIKDLRGMTFKQLKHKYALNDGNMFDTVSVDDTIPFVRAYLKRNRPEIDEDEFLMGLDKYTFESKMVEIGAVV